VKTVFKWIAAGLALASLIGVMGYLAGFFEEKIDPHAGRAPAPGAEVPTYVVRPVMEPLIEQAAGTVRAKTETMISSVVTATISSVNVRAGDDVQQGQVLIKLDTRQMKARVGQTRQAAAAARAQLAQIEQDAARLQRIYQKDPGAVSRAQLERSQSKIRTARAELQRARKMVDEARTGLSYGTLAAPISGRVIARYAEPGDTAGQGQPLLRIYDPTRIRLEAFVRESIAAGMTIDRRFDVTVDALGKTFEGRVEEIVPAAEPGSRSFLVKVGLPSAPGLYPGMFGRLLIPVGETQRRYIPLGAVMQVGQLDFVFVASSQGRVRRFLRLGRTGPADTVEVISGLADGEEVILPVASPPDAKLSEKTGDR
jgi:RND family efflux transporter MFP subunit